MKSKKIDGYYSGEEVRKHDFDVAIIIGQRSNGKSYDWVTYALREYAAGHGQFVYMRRFTDEIVANKAKQQMADKIKMIKSLFGDNAELDYYGGQYLLYRDGKQKGITRDQAEVIGYTFAVSGWSKYKSLSYPRVNLIIYDEFLTHTTRAYMGDEFADYLQNLSTIIRNRSNVKIVLIANTVTQYSVYFRRYGIDTRILKPGTITKFETAKGLKIIVERCKESSITEPSAKYFDFDDGAARMITSGEWEVDSRPSMWGRFTTTELLKQRTYRRAVAMRVDMDGRVCYITLPRKLELPIVVSRSVYNQKVVRLNGLGELKFYKKPKKVWEYLDYRGMVVSESDEVTEIYDILSKNLSYKVTSM